MPTRPIRIMGSNPSTGNLELNDHGHTIAARGDTILWQIDPHSGVDSIVSIEEKSGSTNIFSTPPRRQGNNWTGDISSTVPPLTTYIYSITWKKGNDCHVCDPIISIRPSTAPPGFIGILLFAVSALIGLFTLQCLRKRKRSKI